MINGEEGVVDQELLPDFVLGYVEDMSDVLNHLLVRPGGLRFSGTVGGRRSDHIGGATSMTVGRQ